MSSNASLGAYGIMYVVQNKKIEVIALLLKNGIVVPDNSSDVQIGLLVTNLLKSSKSFYADFSKLLLTEDVVSGMSSNMSGSYANVGGEGVGYTFGSSGSGLSSKDSTFDFNIFKGGTDTTTPTKTTKTSTSGSGWLNTGLGLLQTGFQGYLQLDDNKTKRALADASVQVTQNQTSGEANTLPIKTGLSTGAIVGLSLLGVAVIGLVVYFVAKKK